MLWELIYSRSSIEIPWASLAVKRKVKTHSSGGLRSPESCINFFWHTSLNSDLVCPVLASNPSVAKPNSLHPCLPTLPSSLFSSLSCAGSVGEGGKWARPRLFDVFLRGKICLSCPPISSSLSTQSDQARHRRVWHLHTGGCPPQRGRDGGVLLTTCPAARRELQEQTADCMHTQFSQMLARRDPRHTRPAVRSLTIPGIEAVYEGNQWQKRAVLCLAACWQVDAVLRSHYFGRLHAAFCPYQISAEKWKSLILMNNYCKNLKNGKKEKLTNTRPNRKRRFGRVSPTVFKEWNHFLFEIWFQGCRPLSCFIFYIKTMMWNMKHETGRLLSSSAFNFSVGSCACLHVCCIQAGRKEWCRFISSVSLHETFSSLIR